MRTIALSLLASASILIPATAQQGPLTIDNRIRTATTNPTTVEPRANIRVDVNMTLIPVTVLDEKGHSVIGLNQDNFRVFDGTESRPIVSFGQQDAPVSVGIVFDTSRSMTEKYQTARLAPKELLQQLNPEDESFLITVADKPQLRQGFTSDFDEIQNALLFANTKGVTPLLDGVYMGIAMMKKAKNQRKALIVVSDGGDNNSRYTLQELTAIAAEADVQIYSMCLWNHPATPEERTGPELLEKLSLASGGVSYMINDAALLHNAMNQVGVSLHNQYVLGYYPPDNLPAGKYRKVKVQLLLPRGLPHLQMYARSGYYAPER